MRELTQPKPRPNGKNAQACVEIPPPLMARVNKIAERRMTSRASIMREAIVYYLESVDPTHTPSHTPHPAPVASE